MAFVALMPFLLTSCDEDEELAIHLDGIWQGDFGMDSPVAYSEVEFIWDSGAHGHGYQYDYDIYDRQVAEWQFNWSVDRGNIYFTYPYYSDMDLVIYDYLMKDQLFIGYFSANHYDTDKVTLHKVTRAGQGMVLTEQK